MKWSWKIAKVAGIGIYMHWTFLLILAWVAFATLQQGENLAAAAMSVGFILAIFACVVLHELGHALTARRFGIGTRDITLLPIGGVARLERMPRDPTQELLVAIAGPAVNVVIAAVLFVILAGASQLRMIHTMNLTSVNFLSQLMWVNVVLVVFNLLPAFPMDGGRVLRSLLARKMSYERATQAAANVGQAMAIMFGVLGFFVNWFLLFIAIFVYLGAGAEAQMVRTRSLFGGASVRDAMVTEFHRLVESDHLGRVIEELLAGAQQDFPVLSDGRVVGMLFRQDLIKALKEHGPDVTVGRVMSRPCEAVDVDERLEQTHRRMQEAGCSALPVVRDGRLVGLITIENILEWTMVNSALQQFREQKSLERQW